MVFSFEGQQLYEIQDGRFGKPVPADIVSTLANDVGISADMEEFARIIKSLNVGLLP